MSGSNIEEKNDWPSHFFSSNTNLTEIYYPQNIDAGTVYVHSITYNKSSNECNYFSSKSVSGIHSGMFSTLLRALKLFAVILCLIISTFSGISSIEISIFVDEKLINLCNKPPQLDFQDFHYTVQTLNDLNRIISEHKSKKMSFTIVVSQSDDWPNVSGITPTKLVHEVIVESSSVVSRIPSFLSFTPILKGMVFNNAYNRLCEDRQQSLSALEQQKTAISLSSVTFSYFGSACQTLMEIIANKLVLNGLEEIRLLNSILNSEGVKFVNTILERSRETLKQIEIRNATITNGILNLSPTKFSKTTSAVLEIFNEQDVPFVRYNFCLMFPSLAHLSFGSVQLKWGDTIKIFSCRNLKTLQCAIQIPEFQSNFSIKFLSESFPNLENADLLFLFKYCIESKHGNYILDMHTMRDKLLPNLLITGNCSLNFSQ